MANNQAQLRIAPTAELWYEELDNLLTLAWPQVEGLRMLGSISEYIAVTIENSDDPEKSEQQLRKALFRLVAAWEPPQAAQRCLAVDARIQMHMILNLISVYEPQNGAAKTLSWYRHPTLFAELQQQPPSPYGEGGSSLKFFDLAEIILFGQSVSKSIQQRREKRLQL